MLNGLKLFILKRILAPGCLRKHLAQELLLLSTSVSAAIGGWSSSFERKLSVRTFPKPLLILGLRLIFNHLPLPSPQHRQLWGNQGPRWPAKPRITPAARKEPRRGRADSKHCWHPSSRTSRTSRRWTYLISFSDRENCSQAGLKVFRFGLSAG